MPQQHTSNSNSEKPAPEARKADSIEALLQGDRFHFNSGFHQGVDDAVVGRLAPWHGTKHFQPIYEAAYNYGSMYFQTLGARPESSANAWHFFTQCREIAGLSEVGGGQERLVDLVTEARDSANPLGNLHHVARQAVAEHARGAMDGFHWAWFTERLNRYLHGPAERYDK